MRCDRRIDLELAADAFQLLASDSLGRCTFTSPSTWVWQASRMPAVRSAAEMKCRSRSPGGSTSPSSTRTRQRPHRPWPPHTETMATPPARAASSSVAPRGTEARRPTGSKSTVQVVASAASTTVLG
jgi:hypothetical protein